MKLFREEILDKADFHYLLWNSKADGQHMTMLTFFFFFFTPTKISIKPGTYCYCGMWLLKEGIA